VSSRVPYIDQGHHVLSLFRQQTDAENRGLLAEMLEIAEGRRPKTTNGSKEAEANDGLQQMLPHLIRQSAEITPYQLGHIAINWGHLDLSNDLGSQFTRHRAVRGGQASGRIRRQKAADDWHRHALELAIGIREQTPSIGQRNLASDIQALWRQKGWLPGFDSILAFVRCSEKTGTLTKRRV